MMVAIDTCSLVALVRYYLPFDQNARLFNFVKHKIESKEVVVIDKVYEEAKYVSKAIVVATLPYLKKNHVSTVECLPNKSFFNDVDNRFIDGRVRSLLSAEQYESQKRTFLESADAKLLLFCKRNENLMVTPRIVTEETEGSNDNKGFKKIPALCKLLSIDSLTLPELLKEWGAISPL